MSVAQSVAAHLPCLRRFARAVSTLEAVLADLVVFGAQLPLRVVLYRSPLEIINSIDCSARGATDALESGEADAQRNLELLAASDRQAFLLIAVGEFSMPGVALVLDVGEDELHRLIDEAGRQIADQLATDVVIIEDESLIALQLERLVTALGHRVAKIARTERQAIEAVRGSRTGLILAGIRLAGGGSGLDAVNEILRTYSVPVVFVTAYPQRLLTGVRPEPTFLIAKPFHPDSVRAVISQALFFDVRGRP